MAVQASDIEFRYSIPTAAAGDQLTQNNPANSLGRYVSQTAWPGGGLHDLFQELTGADNAAMVSEFRCVFVVNKNVTSSWDNVRVWVSTDTQPGGAEIAIGVDPTPASLLNTTTAQAVTISNPKIAPLGVSFSKPLTYASGLNLGNIGPGQCRAIWLRRSGQNTAGLANETCVLTFQGDTL